MLHFTPPGADVLLLTDVRTLGDANLDAKAPKEPGRHSVLGAWWPGTCVWGTQAWRGTVARACLFEFGQRVDKEARGRAKAELEAYLKAHNFRFILVLQSRSKSARLTYDDSYAEASHTGSVSWDFFRPPADLSSMAWTFWGTDYGTVVPLLNPQNVDYVYGAILCRVLSAVHARVSVFLPPQETTWTEEREDGKPPLYAGLARILKSTAQGVPLAIDIESYSTTDLITVLGLSDGEHTCAVPWEPFTPYGTSYREPGLHLGYERGIVARILATAKTAILHNGIRFDVPYLARKGLRVAGRIFDTYLAHGVLYNQLRHGLQQAVAYEFPVPPWKTLHTESAAASGLDPEDADAWIQCPRELRQYNAQDTFFTYWLGQRLASYGGVTL